MSMARFWPVLCSALVIGGSSLCAVTTHSWRTWAHHDHTARATDYQKRDVSTGLQHVSVKRRQVKPPPRELYGPPRPVEIYGPPLPYERQVDQEQANRLLAYYRAGSLTLTVPEREEAQLRELAQHGLFCWPAPPAGAQVFSDRQRDILAGTALPDKLPRRAVELASRASVPQIQALTMADPADDPDFDPLRKPPSPLLLRILVSLAGHSTPDRPLELMSLLRPPYRTGRYIHVGPTNPHSLGLAADIAAYGGYRICQANPEDCVAATLALLRDLPPGCYRLGMPKAPDSPLIVGQPPVPISLATWLPDLVTELNTPNGSPGSHGGVYAAALCAVLGQPSPPWPFFPAPQPLLEQGRVAPLRIAGKPVLDANRQPVPCIIRFRNESYAEIEDLHDPRLRDAILAARKHGVEIVGLFPDGADHIHIDVRQRR